MSEPDAELDLLKKACESLGEHFETVHIFVTRLKDDDEPEDRGTINANWGSGNWFTRYGQIHTWLVKQDEQSRKEVRERE